MRCILFLLLFASCTKVLPIIQKAIPPPVPHNLLIIENQSSNVNLYEIWENGLGLYSYGRLLVPGQTLVDSNYSVAKDSYADGTRWLSFNHTGIAVITYPGGTVIDSSGGFSIVL